MLDCLQILLYADNFNNKIIFDDQKNNDLILTLPDFAHIKNYHLSKK